MHYKTLIITAVLLLYLAIGYYPFQVEMPLRVTENAARYSQADGLQLLQPGIARTAGAPPWLAAAIATSTLDVALEVKPAHSQQYGPARIFTVSKDPYLRNLTIAQEGTDLIVRLRTPATDLNGLPPYRAQGALSAPGWHRVELHIVPQRLQLRIDGAVALSATLPRNALATWAPDYRLALGNELSDDRPWRGEIRVARVRAGDWKVDYSQPDALDIPRHLVTIQAHHILNPFTRETVTLNADFVINLLGFIPLGILIMCVTGGRWSIVAATAACASLSLTIEAGQLFFAGRVTETADLILNALGGALGAWMATQARSCTQRHSSE